MTSPQILRETPLTLVDVQEALKKIEKRDKELNYRSHKVKEHLRLFVTLSLEKKEKLSKKLKELNLLRLKEIHLTKIIDFLPQTVEELRVVLQGYSVNLSKKDMEKITAVVREIHEEIKSESIGEKRK